MTRPTTMSLCSISIVTTRLLARSLAFLLHPAPHIPEPSCERSELWIVVCDIQKAHRMRRPPQLLGPPLADEPFLTTLGPPNTLWASDHPGGRAVKPPRALIPHGSGRPAGTFCEIGRRLGVDAIQQAGWVTLHGQCGAQASAAAIRRPGLGACKQANLRHFSPPPGERLSRCG